MEVIAKLGSILGLSFISGINLYATVAMTGLCVKFEWVQGLPPEFQVLAHDAVIFVALFLYLLEFFADKIQGLDTLWDSIHTVIRPLGGALIALMQVGEASPAVEVIVFMIGASAASAAHMAKAGSRLLVNASPEPFSNIAVSVVEDAAVIGLSYLSLSHPIMSFFLTLVFLSVIAILLPLLFRTVRMIFSGFLFRIKSLLHPPDRERGIPVLPLSLDMFLEYHKDEDEEILWAGRSYAGRISSIPRFFPVTVVMTTEALYCLYRRWFRYKARRLSRSDLRGYRCYPGRLFTKCLINASGETWLLHLYQPLAKTIPQDLSTQRSENAG